MHRDHIMHSSTAKRGSHGLEIYYEVTCSCGAPRGQYWPIEFRQLWPNTPVIE